MDIVFCFWPNFWVASRLWEATNLFWFLARENLINITTILMGDVWLQIGWLMPRSHQTFRPVPTVKLLGIMLRNRCWSTTTFHTITTVDADRWCHKWLVWSTPHPLTYHTSCWQEDSFFLCYFFQFKETPSNTQNLDWLWCNHFDDLTSTKPGPICACSCW